jgi:TonB family protein
MAEINKKAAPVKGNKPKLDPFVASMLPESDKRTASFMGVCAMISILLSFLAKMYEVAIDELLFDVIEGDELLASIKIDEKKEDKKEEKKKAENPRKKEGAGGKPRGKGQPKAPQTRGVLKLLTSKTSKASMDAYSLMSDKNLAKDLDKVLKNVSGLQTSGNTVLGDRRGAVDGGFNEGYAEGGAGGLGDMLGGLIGGSAGGIGTKTKSGVRGPSSKEIEMGGGDGSRSKAEIMAVINSRVNGLKSIYNRYLKNKPGFSGKVTLRFTIAPSGEIISISVISSTTGYPEFDAAIMNMVKTWKWKTIKSGNTTPTIPFNFFE